ncbi:MAG: threonylcarbamoyl-AMP synthase [Clostridiales bacterium]|nr:threonylcarbamoyl-AMP synthase [Clostridiales bacterium]
METEILKPKEGIKKAAKIIKEGGIVAFPTETVYGLGASALNSDAVAKIFEAKGRPKDNPLIVHLSKPKDAEKIAREIPGEFYKLAKKFMPGPLTIVLKKAEAVPDIVTAGGDTVAVRVPKNKTARRLIKLSGPIAAPSANRSKHVSPTAAIHVYEDLKGEIPLIIDGGASKVGIESTVLDLTSEFPTILRPGAVTAQMIAKVIGFAKEHSGEIKVAKSPGMKYTHYAPSCPAVIGGSFDECVAEFLKSKAEGKKPVVICRTGNKMNGIDIIELGRTEKKIASSVYGALRLAEKNFNYIIIENLGKTGVLGAVMNRLYKAAGGREV